MITKLIFTINWTFLTEKPNLDDLIKIEKYVDQIVMEKVAKGIQEGFIELKNKSILAEWSYKKHTKIT